MTGHRLYVVVKAGKVVDAFLSEEMAREVQLDIGDECKWRKDVWVELRYFASHGTRMNGYDVERPGVVSVNQHTSGDVNARNGNSDESSLLQGKRIGDVDDGDSMEGKTLDTHPVSTPVSA